MPNPPNPPNHDSLISLARLAATAMRDENEGARPRGWARQALAECPPQIILADFSQPLLHLACSLAMPDCVALLLDFGADPLKLLDPQSSGLFSKLVGLSPLMVAAGSGSATCVDLLGAKLQALGALEASLAQTDREGATAFHLAAKRKHDEALRSLVALDSLSPPNKRHAWVQDKNGNTPAILAARAGHRPSLEALPPDLAPWRLVNREGFSALSMAIQHRNIECCEFFAQLLSKPAFSPQSRSRLSALAIFEASQPHPLVQAALLDEHAIFAALAPAAMACQPEAFAARDQILLHCKTSWGSTGLQHAALLCLRANRHWREAHDAPLDAHVLPIQEALWSAACDVDPRPLLVAFERLRSASPDAARGAFLGAIPKHPRSTILHACAKNAHAQAIDAIGQWLGPIAPTIFDRVDPLGRSPLAIAASIGSLEACEALLRWGADPAVSDFSGRTPLMHAIHAGSLACASILQAEPGPNRLPARFVRSADGTSPAMVAAAAGRLDLLQWIIPGMPLDESHGDAHGDTLIHHACKAPEGSRSLACLAAALALPGADPNARNRQGLSPLDLACARGWMPGIEILAPLADRSHDFLGRHPLGAAVERACREPRDDTRAIALLLAQWIDPRLAEVHHRLGGLGPALNAAQRAAAFNAPAFAQELERVATLWDCGRAPGAQPPPALRLEQAANLFREKIATEACRLASLSSRGLPPRKSPP